MEKIIIMGLAQSGKTTIVKVTAEGYIPQKKAEYTATLDYKRNTYDLFGTKISMFDLGGQKSFLDRFIGELAEFVFTNVSALIFVIDVSNMDTISLAKYYYDMGKKTLAKYSPKAKTKILLHKIDLIDKSKKDDFLESVKEFLEYDKADEVFETNVFDQTIFNAMEKIIKGIKNDITTMEGTIEQFKDDYSEFIEFISIRNKHGEELVPYISNIENFKMYLEHVSYDFDKEFNSEDKLMFVASQFGSKLVFQAIIINDHLLTLVFSKHRPELLDETYIKILNGSIKFAKDLNVFL